MVTLIGEGITVDELAHHFGTIGYEVLTSLGPRYARVYKGGARHDRARRLNRHPRSRPDDLWSGMKIATFNINNINRRLPNLLRWLHQAKPDVVCLQELKSTDADFPVAAIDKAGYGAVWRGQKTWNGVAILARNADPVLIRTALPGDPDDHEARYIEAAVSGIIVTSIYLPNGNPLITWSPETWCMTGTPHSIHGSAPYDMPEQMFDLTLGNLRGAGAKISAGIR